MLFLRDVLNKHLRGKTSERKSHVSNGGVPSQLLELGFMKGAVQRVREKPIGVKMIDNDRQELRDANVVTRTGKDGSQEWSEDVFNVETATSASVASISGDVPGIIVEWREMAPSAKV